jgi:hypothetical protein
MPFLRGETAASLAAAAQAPAAAGDLARRVLEDPAYQRQLPTPSPETPALPHLQLPWLGRLFEILAYAAVAVVAALLAVWIVRLLLARRSREVGAVEAEEAAADLDVRLEQPDQLAAAGRYAEAIHQLLLETLAALSRAASLPASFTSREVLLQARLPARAREALSGLVLAVELSRFGGEPASEADYRACQARFQEFLASYRGQAEAAA